MAHDFSSRKVASANGNMTATIFNGLFSDVKTAIEALYTKVRQMDSTAASVWTNDDTVSTGQSLPASFWNAKVGCVNACILDLKDRMADSENTVQIGDAPMEDYMNQQKEAQIPNTAWNRMIDIIAGYLDVIEADLDTQIGAWKVGDPMPMELS